MHHWLYGGPGHPKRGWSIDKENFPRAFNVEGLANIKHGFQLLARLENVRRKKGKSLEIPNQDHKVKSMMRVLE